MNSGYIGTIICLNDTPNTDIFYAIQDINNKIIVKKGQYAEIPVENGTIVGQIIEILKTNRYFSQIDTIAELVKGGHKIEEFFPADLWEFALIKIKGLAVLTKNGIETLGSPPSPGSDVYLANEKTLEKLLGFSEEGINIGMLKNHIIPVKLDVDKLVRKHIAVLAMSGAGKSYTTSVIIEELLKRKIEQGRLAIIIFDVHGEYLSFGDSDSIFKNQTQIIPASAIQFATARLDRFLISNFLPQMSSIQYRDLSRIITQFRKETSSKVTLRTLIQKMESDEKINPKTKDALLNWILDLEDTYLFGPVENPKWEDIISPGKLIIIDMKDLVSLRKKQMILTYVAYRLFNLRRRDKIPPVLLVIEEAHQFCPEAQRELAISKHMLETIAREGRKFYTSLLLVSQRPVRLSTTVLSQCNTQIIMKITNPYDLQHIGATSEKIDKDTLNAITGLGIGEALVVGEATNYPIFVEVRERHVKGKTEYESTIKEVSIKFEKK